MVLLLICIVLNTFIGVVFKLFNKFQINVLAAIVVNYFTCVITGSIIEGNWLIKPSIIEEKWFYYALSLGVIFIITFNLVAWTIKEYGIMIATIFQKMSLLFPTMIAIFIYQETNSFVKSLGIVMAMTAIILISFPSGKRKFNWVLFWVPLGTWIFSGLIESSLYYVNIENIVSSANISFVTSIFFFAGFFGLLMLILQLSLPRILVLQ